MYIVEKKYNQKMTYIVYINKKYSATCSCVHNTDIGAAISYKTNLKLNRIVNSICIYVNVLR